MKTCEFENLNQLVPSKDLLERCREANFILQEDFPLWWATDYSLDPREYLPFTEFRKRLVHLHGIQGSNPTHEDFEDEEDGLGTDFSDDDPFKEVGSYFDQIFKGGKKSKDVYLYPYPQIPMSVIELDVAGLHLPFLITARPYHPKEVSSSPYAPFITKHPIETLDKYLKDGKSLDIPNHFYPHIRGLFTSKRGNHLFWYPVHLGSEHCLDTKWETFGKPLLETLKTEGLDFLDVYKPPMYSGYRKYTNVWYELVEEGSKLIDPKPRAVDFTYKKVTAEELLTDYEQEEGFITQYPLTVPELSSTLPLVIANKTNEGNRIRKLAILGIYADNGCTGYSGRSGILRLRDQKFAQHLSQAITKDFKTPVDAVLFTPQKGRPKYERISSN